MPTAYTCEKCGKSFHQKSNLDNHLKRKTPCILPVETEIVPSQSPSNSSLEEKIELILKKLEILENRSMNMSNENTRYSIEESESDTESIGSDFNSSEYVDEMSRLLKSVKSFVEYDNTEIYGTPSNRVRTLLIILSDLMRRDIPLSKLNSSMREYMSLRDVLPLA